jgi:ubiquinol-cytochrome c reductase cytochrome b subunit
MGSRMNGLVTWIDARFPMTKMWEEHLSKYYAPKNFNFWYFFGSLALLVLVLQIVTGIFLTMHYKPDGERVDALPAFDRFVDVLYRRVSAHAAWPHVRLVQEPA